MAGAPTRIKDAPGRRRARRAVGLVASLSLATSALAGIGLVTFAPHPPGGVGGSGDGFVANLPGGVLLRPVSERGLAVGVPVPFEMPHCGLHSPVDIDGSFWDPVDRPWPQVDGRTGTFTLQPGGFAVFRTFGAGDLLLVRHAGDKAFQWCA